MRCSAILITGSQCTREARDDSPWCALHRAVELRREDRAFYLDRLSIEDHEALAEAARVEGLDGEIAILRLLARRAASQGRIDSFRRGLETLCRALEAKHDLERKAPGRLSTALEAALDRLAREEDEAGEG
jgi:hypothetical protein